MFLLCPGVANLLTDFPDAWCQGERNTCPQICGGSANSNTCDPVRYRFYITPSSIPSFNLYRILSPSAASAPTAPPPMLHCTRTPFLSSSARQTLASVSRHMWATLLARKSARKREKRTVEPSMPPPWRRLLPQRPLPHLLPLRAASRHPLRLLRLLKRGLRPLRRAVALLPPLLTQLLRWFRTTPLVCWRRSCSFSSVWLCKWYDYGMREKRHRSDVFGFEIPVACIRLSASMLAG